MKTITEQLTYNAEDFKQVASGYMSLIANAANAEVARERLYRRITRHQFDTHADQRGLSEAKVIRVRDSSRALRGILKSRSDQMAGFSVIQAIYDIVKDTPRPELQPGFYTDLVHMFMGMRGEGPAFAFEQFYIREDLEGREAAIDRSRHLDKLWAVVEEWMDRYKHGLQPDVIERRKKRRQQIMSQLGGTENDWNDWKWHVRNVIKRPTQLHQFIPLTHAEQKALKLVEEAGLPFGITPYYLSLMDEEGEDDRAVRAQVIPPESYVEFVANNKEDYHCSFDFMLEKDTSPIDLVTRRYPAIVILKPYNTCPQICVYCQRNWEIDEAMSDGALAPQEKIDQAIGWIADHRAIKEVLVTGGDPAALGDKKLFGILQQVAEIDHIQRIRLGTRTPVTVPMRITDQFVERLSALRIPMRREVSVVTHVEHPYEITPEMFEAVEKLRAARINVYNQNVYTFYVSRRFEAALLRGLLKRIGIEPYYTFNTKGKEETVNYRVPIARLMQ
ncbi:MAG: KamA family radical SAM protein, partial [Chloroflexi bacterium]|nr:KamA family radical SAM protein [Chloroflexota bacterium]